jgi:hypothetical protein
VLQKEPVQQVVQTIVLPLTVTIDVEQAAYTAVADKASKIAANVFICCVPEKIVLH